MKENPPYTIHGYQYGSPVSYPQAGDTLKETISSAAYAVDYNIFRPARIADKDGAIVVSEDEMTERIHQVWEEQDAKEEARRAT